MRAYVRVYETALFAPHETAYPHLPRDPRRRRRAGIADGSARIFSAVPCGGARTGAKTCRGRASLCALKRGARGGLRLWPTGKRT